ncbi:MAG: NAD(P)/FAD-dependent oxidoreductase [Candidatus Peregrinibacteria bacterium]|nr:NAD(P)/FAD-dependent oxidoreductase [Candidatus Peregrinibacteria bacterium]MCB9808007.1 NAD(P)/FAD-dependent oxidoreductase [Candidatus Peribacteria bacterium]
MSSTKVAVIAGAGPAGLTAAYELLKRTDIKPIVLEATDAIGGIAQTYNYKGNRIDIGGHRFFSKSKRVMDWWFNILPLQGAPAADTEEMQHEIDYATEVVVKWLCPECALEGAEGTGGTEVRMQAPDPEKEHDVMLQRPRKSRIYFQRNFFPYPIGITLKIAWRLGLINTTLIGLSYIKAQVFKRKDETHLDAFMINRFGMRLYKTFFEDYTEKVWGVPCSQIKADWGAQRIKGLSLRRAVVHAVKDLLSSDFSKAQAERETSLITRFYYPKFGPGQMWETVSAQIQQCGGEVHMKKRVVGVRWKGAEVTEESDERKLIQGVTVEDVETGETEEVECDYFFSTMPVRHLITHMRPLPPDRVTEVAEGLIYRDFLTVGLLLNKLNVQEKGKDPATSVPDNWIYVQDRGVKVGRIQVFNNWSPYMVEDRKNTVWIGLEYFVNEGDELWVKPDADMIAQGIAELEQIGFISKEDVIDSCVLRMPKAYPAYFGSYDQLDTVRDYSLQFENLFLIGRNGMHRYNNQDHSMLTAMTAVDNIVAGITDHKNIWEVNAERTYHEEK